MRDGEEGQERAAAQRKKKALCRRVPEKLHDFSDQNTLQHFGLMLFLSGQMISIWPESAREWAKGRYVYYNTTTLVPTETRV